MITTIRPTGTNDTHYILGSAPGWAHCDAWIDSGEVATESIPTCKACAAYVVEAVTTP
ncbi:hypothetical protein ACIRPH_30915 [Nocardiopsis sp. NPDC101807]|uniref:hypothetical protein n=1 Tax=Nocardiopsis sp. NPDC101807 TaxID=3364339 RepID=UPI0037F23C94